MWFLATFRSAVKNYLHLLLKLSWQKCHLFWVHRLSNRVPSQQHNGITMEREQSYEDIKRKLNLKEYKLHFFVPMTVCLRFKEKPERNLVRNWTKLKIQLNNMAFNEIKVISVVIQNNTPLKRRRADLQHSLMQPGLLYMI